MPAPPQTNSLQPQLQPKLEHPPGLSRFAELYVPVWLRRVNADRPQYVVPRSKAEAFSVRPSPCPLVSLPESDASFLAAQIEYSEVHDALYPPRLIHHLGVIERKNHERLLKEHYGRATSQGRFPARPAPLALAPATYAHHWLPLQQAEYTARALQLQQAALYAVPLRPVAPHPGDPPGPPLYMLEARSIREGWPPVDLGDILNLRQLRPNFQSWQGLEFEASVAGINRAAGEVLLRCDSLMGYQEAMVFNVVWRVQDRIFNEWRRSTELADLYLNSSSILQDGPPAKRRRTAIDSWLFPQSEDVSVHGPAPTKDDLDPEWVDESLNEEQRVCPSCSLPISSLDIDARPALQNAIRSIIWGKQRCPLLLHGPPGTGKTKTLVEAVFQILKRGSRLPYFFRAACAGLRGIPYRPP